MPNFSLLGIFSFTTKKEKSFGSSTTSGSNHFVIYGKVYFEKICPIFVSSALFHLQKKILWFVHILGINVLKKIFHDFWKDYFKKICPIFVSSAPFHLQKKQISSTSSGSTFLKIKLFSDLLEVLF